MGYQTKFDIGQKVYFIEKETSSGVKCNCCDRLLPSSEKLVIRRSKVSGIFINNSYEFYNLIYPRSLTANKLYSTKEEAEIAISQSR